MNLLHEFWNSASDMCPLEATEQEQQEKAFEEWMGGRIPSEKDIIGHLTKMAEESLPQICTTTGV